MQIHDIFPDTLQLPLNLLERHSQQALQIPAGIDRKPAPVFHYDTAFVRSSRKFFQENILRIFRDPFLPKSSRFFPQHGSRKHRCDCQFYTTDYNQTEMGPQPIQQ